MSLFVKILGSGEKVRKARQERKVDKLPEREELLNKKTEFLKKRIDQELLCAKKNCRKNRRAALQALRRKKWCEKHLNHVDCSSEAMRSAHEHACSEIINKVNDLMKEIMEEEEEEEAAASLISSVSQKVEFDEDELLAELERLERSLDENLFQEDREEDREEDRDLSSPVLSAASPSHPAKMDEDDDEDDLEYLRRWASQTLLDRSLDGSLFDEDRVCSSSVSASPARPAKMEVDEDEDDLEYLRRWAEGWL